MIRSWIISEERRVHVGMSAGFIVGFAIVMSLWWSAACATTPAGRARQAAIVQKTAVDGLGNAYLGYCRIVRRPSCMEKDAAATQSGTPQTKADRVACLRPCDSQTATKIQTGVDVLRTAQTGLFELLHTGDATDAELQDQRVQLRRAADQLLTLLEETGAMDVLGDAVGGLAP